MLSFVRATDPITRMMLIERALKLHHQALEARERAARKSDPKEKAARRPGR